MAPFRFTWDPAKARANERKHGIGFGEASTVFFDESATEFNDDRHSDWEDRYLLLGMSDRMRLVLVCYTRRRRGRVIRLISARRPTPREAAHYREYDQ